MLLRIVLARHGGQQHLEQIAVTLEAGDLGGRLAGGILRSLKQYFHSIRPIQNYAIAGLDFCLSAA